MELNITAKNLDISEQVRQYIEKKLGKLVRHLPHISDSRVEIAWENTKAPQHRYVVQVTLNSRGTLLRGEVRAPALATAIDEVAEVLDRQIERYKGKLQEKGRKTEARQGPEAPGAAESQPDSLRRIVREKRFPVKPMSAEEAAHQMELLGHDFFIFLNAENGKLCVLYRRRDGYYGLIEPSIG